MKIEMVVVCGIIATLGYYFWRWFKKGEIHPNPWGPEIEEAIHSPDALPVCHHCFTPQEEEDWFCPECGAAIGPYNNYMPFIYVFSQGEVLRNGVDRRISVNFITVVGYLLLSASAYMIFAPVYWYFLFRNIERNRNAALSASE